MTWHFFKLPIYQHADENKNQPRQGKNMMRAYQTAQQTIKADGTAKPAGKFTAAGF